MYQIQQINCDCLTPLSLFLPIQRAHNCLMESIPRKMEEE